MTDAELTRLASKAFGNAPAGFSPLTDDGDALRLAVKLKLDVLWAEHEKSVVVCNDSSNNEPVTEKVRFTIDPCAATRRAIVRAAYEIGKAT